MITQQHNCLFSEIFGMIPCFIALYFSTDWHQNGRKIKIKQWRLGFLRGAFVALAQLCLYTSYLYLPFALVATMEYTGPMMVTLLSVLFLEKNLDGLKHLQLYLVYRYCSYYGTLVI